MEEEKETVPLVSHGYPRQPDVTVVTYAPPGENQNMNDLPFCSPFMVFFFLGFIFPICMFGGMAGLASKKPHEYWIGKLSAIFCGIFICSILLMLVL